MGSGFESGPYGSEILVADEELVEVVLVAVDHGDQHLERTESYT